MSADKSAKLFELDVIEANLAKGVITRDDVLAYLDHTVHLRNIRRQVILAAIVELLVAGLSVPEICATAGVGYELNVTPHDPDALARVLNEKVLDGDFWTAQRQKVLELLADNATDKDRLSALFDLRVRERNLSRGLITKGEVAIFQAALEDCDSNADISKLTVQHTHGYRDGEGEPLSQDEA